MPPQNRNPDQNRPAPNLPKIDEATFKAIVEQQSKKVDLELRKVALEEKRLASDTQLAEKSMELNAGLMKNEPCEHRKTTKTYALIIGIFGCMLATFILVCLFMGKESFLISLLKGLKDFGIAILSFFIGRKTGSKPKEERKETIPDAEVVE